MHLHQAEFQMIYVLKGSMTTEFEGQGVHTMKAGDSWLQPPSIRHKVLDYSDDCEVLEIVMPGNFKTVELEK
jgi:quercetin dioxygenase-like cupin family protein